MGKKYAKKLRKIARNLKSFQSPDWEVSPEKVEAKILGVRKIKGEGMLRVKTDLGEIMVLEEYRNLVKKGKEVYLFPNKGILKINQHEIPTLKIPEMKTFGEILPGKRFRPPEG